MKAVQKVLNKPLRPLGVLLPTVTAAELRELLWKEIFVVIDSANPFFPLQCDKSVREMTQSELVDRLVSNAFDNFKDEEHTFLLGFKQGATFEPKNSFGKFGVKFPNWMISYFKTPVWEKLLREIGDAAMIALLRNYQLFFKQNKCFIQLTGRVFHKLITLQTKPKPAPIRMKLDSFIDPKRRVSREQVRKLALQISHAKPQQQKRSRLDKSWIKATPLLQRLLENHRKCPYNHLLSQAMALQTAQSDTEQLLLSLKHRETSLAVVSRYLKSVLRRIVPEPFWGNTPQVRRQILSKLHHTLVLLPHTHAPHMFDEREMRMLPLAAFSWLVGKHRRRQCLLQFMRFLFNVLARDVLCSRFVQLVSPQGQVAFYLHTAYHTHVISEYLLDNPQQFCAARETGRLDELKRKMKLRGFGPVKPRFGLKKTRDRFRLIMNLSRKTLEFPFPANVHFRPAFHALSYELNQTPELGGSFVQGLDLIHQKYLKFRRLQRGAVYCVAVDVEKCYDTMQPSLVYEICKQTLRCEEYAVSTKSITFWDEGMRRIRTKHLKIVHPENDDYTNLLTDPAFTTANSSFVATDGINRQFVTRDKVLSLVSELLHHTYVDFGEQAGGLRRMKQGVPQGSVLSTLLCRLYYGQFEREVLYDFVAAEENLLMRFVDDFIFFTPHLEQVEAFQAKMERGNAKYNCTINASKLQTFNGQRGQPAKWLPWCGLLFHSKTGAVRMKYSSKDTYSGSRVFARGLGTTLRTTARVKLHALLLDLEINTCQNVFCNIAQMLVLCATRYVKFLKYQNLMSGWGEVLDLFSFVHTLIQFRLADCITLNDIECLGVLAFYIKLQRHQLKLDELTQMYKASLSKRRLTLAKSKIHWPRIERAVAAVAHAL